MKKISNYKVVNITRYIICKGRLNETDISLKYSLILLDATLLGLLERNFGQC